MNDFINTRFRMIKENGVYKLVLVEKYFTNTVLLGKEVKIQGKDEFTLETVKPYNWEDTEDIYTNSMCEYRFCEHCINIFNVFDVLRHINVPMSSVNNCPKCNGADVTLEQFSHLLQHIIDNRSTEDGRLTGELGYRVFTGARDLRKSLL